LSRTTPVHNITDDFSWLRGNHSFQFGGNIRLISNRRASFANAFDNATTNPSGYFAGGNSMSDAVDMFGTTVLGQPLDPGFTDSVQAAVTALVGRYSQYSALFTFGHDGQPLAPPFFNADTLHSYYNAHKFLVDDAGLQAARLALIEATRIVLASGLGILGVSAPEKM